MENCHLFDYLKQKWGSLSDKDHVSGSFGDKEFVKNRGSLGDSW